MFTPTPPPRSGTQAFEFNLSSGTPPVRVSPGRGAAACCCASRVPSRIPKATTGSLGLIGTHRTTTWVSSRGSSALTGGSKRARVRVISGGECRAAALIVDYGACPLRHAPGNANAHSSPNGHADCHWHPDRNAVCCNDATAYAPASGRAWGDLPNARPFATSTNRPTVGRHAGDASCGCPGDGSSEVIRCAASACQ